jgi:farnesyl-diphosphate farnesyltransferase
MAENHEINPAARLFPLLKEVSRSFYLSLRVLPKPIRTQIGLAYLLARISDTIADADFLPCEQRLRLLRKYREIITGQVREKLAHEFAAVSADKAVTPGEKAALEHVDEAILLLGFLDPSDQKNVNEVIDIIISGQELDLTRFEVPNPMSSVRCLETDEELDDYTYRVAGCVGRFWTLICHKHLFPNDSAPVSSLLENGIQFGKGLQLINILRDLPSDLSKGRCYIPAGRLKSIGLRPEDLQDKAAEARFRPLFDEYVDRAESFLKSGWDYTNTIPRHLWRMRLSCAWPLLIGIKTLDRLRVSSILDPDNRIKVSRSEVRQILIQTTLKVPFPQAFSRLFQSCRQ